MCGKFCHSKDFLRESETVLTLHHHRHKDKIKTRRLARKEKDQDRYLLDY